MEYKGSCLCGEVAFVIEGEFENFFLCHCKRCQKDTGSAHAANLFSSTAKLTWMQGEEYVKNFDYKNEGHIKSFCIHCGSALPYRNKEEQRLKVPAGCLDSDVFIRPKGHIYYKDKANWDQNLEQITKFEELP